MITVMKTIDRSGTGLLEVLLDIFLKDFTAPAPELKALIAECKKTKRRVGCISRLYDATTFFTYDPANQAQVETSLLAALSTPKSEVHVTQGGGEEWQKF